MASVLHILVGNDLALDSGVPGSNLGDEEDIQEQLEYLTEELHVDPATHTTPDGGVTEHYWFLLADILKAMLERIEALEE